MSKYVIYVKINDHYDYGYVVGTYVFQRRYFLATSYNLTDDINVLKIKKYTSRAKAKNGIKVLMEKLNLKRDYFEIREIGN